MARATLTPIVQGIRRDVTHAAQQGGAMHDCIGLLLQSQGHLDGILRGVKQADFDTTYTPTRWMQWQDEIVQLATNPTSIAAISDGINSYLAGPTGDWRATKYSDYLAMARVGYQAKILIDNSVSDVFTDGSSYISDSYIEGKLSTTPTAVGTVVTVTFGASPLARPVIPSGYYANYIMFLNDSNRAATTARIRPVIGSVGAGTITTITYTGVVPAGLAAGGICRIYISTAATGDASNTLSLDGFFTVYDRLCGHVNNTLMYSGYGGNVLDGTIAPVRRDWTVWNPLNNVNVGSPEQGKIVRVFVCDDTQMVFLESGIHYLVGLPPIAGSDNQLRRREVSQTLGIKGYDAAAISDDGQMVFFIGNDDGFYAATPAGITPIDKPIRIHERNTRLTSVAVAETLVCFSGTECDADTATGNNEQRTGSILGQYPCAFIFDTNVGEWTTFSPVTFDDTENMAPLDDPYRQGGIGSLNINGRNYLAVGTDGKILPINDGSKTTPTAQDYYIQGVAMHQITGGDQALKRVDSVDLVVEGLVTRTMSAAAPVSDPIGAVPHSMRRVTPQKTRGNASHSTMFFRGNQSMPSYGVSVGYAGDVLLRGVDQRYGSEIDLSVTTARFQRVYLPAGYVSRVDFLLHTLTAAHVNIYEDDGEATPAPVSTILHGSDMVEPVSGIVSNSTPYWRSFGVRRDFTAGYYWIALSSTGTCTAKIIPAGTNITNSAGTATNAGRNFMLRVIREFGAPMAARRLTHISADITKLGSVTW